MEKEEFRGVDTDDWTSDDWSRVFDRVKCNSVMFVELFWNVAYPDKRVELTDKQKQRYFDKYRGVPLFNDARDAFEHSKWVDEMKAKGYKDWELA